MQPNHEELRPTVASSPARFLNKSSIPHIATLILISALGAAAMNMFLPSLPSLARYYDVSTATAQLAVSGYLGATALLQLFIGPLSDIYGRRPVTLVGIFIFLIGCVVCIYAPTFELFLLGRLLQAACVVGFVVSRATVRDLVGPDQAASMIGYVTMAMTLSPMIAPTLGGYLDSSFGWQATFVALGLFGVAVIWVVFQDFGETNKNRSNNFKTQFSQYPELLKSRRFWGFTATTAFTSGCFFAFLGGAPFVASEVFLLKPQEFGMLFGFTASGYMFGNFLSGRYSVRFGLIRMIVAGCMTSVIGILIPIVLDMVMTINSIMFFGPLFFLGMGNGMSLPSANAGVISVRPKLAGSAAGLSGSLQIAGGAMLSVIAGLAVNVENGGIGLLLVMLMSAFCSIIAIFYVIHVEKLVGQAAKTNAD